MTKLILFPLLIAVLITIYAVVDTGNTMLGYSYNEMQDQGELIVIDSENSNNLTWEMPTSTGSGQMDLSSVEQSLIILALAFTIGGVAGVQFLGSGLGEFSQKLVFMSVLFIGLWTAFTVWTSAFFFVNSFTELIWIGLTLMFVLGMGAVATSSGDAV